MVRALKASDNFFALLRFTLILSSRCAIPLENKGNFRQSIDYLNMRLVTKKAIFVIKKPDY